MEYSSTEFIICMKLKCQLKDWGSLKFGPLRRSDLRSSLFTTLTSTVMICPAGLLLNDKEQKHIGLVNRFSFHFEVVHSILSGAKSLRCIVRKV